MKEKQSINYTCGPLDCAEFEVGIDMLISSSLSEDELLEEEKAGFETVSVEGGSTSGATSSSSLGRFRKTTGAGGLTSETS